LTKMSSKKEDKDKGSSLGPLYVGVLGLFACVSAYAMFKRAPGKKFSNRLLEARIYGQGAAIGAIGGILTYRALINRNQPKDPKDDDDY